MNCKGFTLVEIMITMFIMVVVVALTVPVYRTTVEGIGEVSSSEEAKLDNLLAMELIRLDLQHVGIGLGQFNGVAPLTGQAELTPAIAYVEPFAPPVIPNSPVLDLRSTVLNTNQATLGWGLINCVINDSAVPPYPNIVAGDYIIDQREVPTNTNLVLLDSGKGFVGMTTPGNYTCPDDVTSGLAVGTPIILTAFPNASGFDACATGFCSNIQYRLSAAQGLETCAQGTRNLIREIDDPAIAPFGDTIVNCVAGFRVRFDVDLDVNQRINEPAETDFTPLTGGNPVTAANPAAITAQVRSIDIYLLVQVGKEDPTLNSNPTLRINDSLGNAIVDFRAAADGGDGDWDAITNPQNYRWKIYKVSGKPNGWL